MSAASRFIDALESTVPRLCLPACVLTTLFFFGLNYVVYRSFRFWGPHDLALFNQVCYRLVEDLSLSETVYGTPNFLGYHHFTPIIVLFAPIYYCLQTPVFLNLVSAVAVSITGYVVWRTADEMLERSLAGLLAFVVFVLHPSIVNIYSLGFRDSILAMAMLSCAMLGYLRRNFRWFCVFSILAALCKEEIPLVLLGFGMLGLIQRRPARWIAFPTVFGCVYFVAVCAFIMPAIRGDTGGFAGVRFSEFRYLGDSPWDIAVKILTDPWTIFAIGTEESKLRFYRGLVQPLGYLPVVAAEYLVAPVTAWLVCILPKDPNQTSTEFYAQAPLIPFLFTAAIAGTQRLAQWIPWVLTKIGTLLKSSKSVSILELSYNQVVMGLLVVLVVNSVLGTNFLARTVFRLSLVNSMYTPFHEVLDKIPRSAVVSAQRAFAPYVSFRDTVYLFPRVDSADYVVLGLNNEPHVIDRDLYCSKLLSTLKSGEYGVLFHDKQDNVILKRGHPTHENEIIVQRMPMGRCRP